MGWYDYLSDLASSLTVQPAYAEEDARQFEGITDRSGQQNVGKDTTSGGIGTAQHDRGATTRGGVSTSTPASGTDEESSDEKDVNEADAQKQQDKGGESEPGHKPGEATDASGQKGPEASGAHGGPVKQGVAKGKEDEEQEEEEEASDEAEEDEEEEEEPEDPKQKLEEECMRTQQCAPLKHHYDECAERVHEQHEQHGKAHEDCVEEFFHLMHCASQCAAPKLFRQLK